LSPQFPPDTATGGWSPWPAKKASSTISAPFWQRQGDPGLSRRKLPFPEGTIIARIAWSYDASEENNKTFGRAQSFVAGHAKNGVQFMVKDSKKYAATGGWGTLTSTTASLPKTAVLTKPAFPATRHQGRDYVFTRYAP
jgi:hypothetical protein